MNMDEKIVDMVDTMNDSLVSVRGDKILMLNPPIYPMTKETAMRVAAWLVVLSDDDGTRFEKILAAVKNT